MATTIRRIYLTTTADGKQFRGQHCRCSARATTRRFWFTLLAAFPLVMLIASCQEGGMTRGRSGAYNVSEQTRPVLSNDAGANRKGMDGVQTIRQDRGANMSILPIFIATGSLVVSLATAWVNLRRGSLRMARPRRILLFPRAIYMDALLFSTGNRGAVLDELLLDFDDGVMTMVLREWVHRKGSEKDYATRMSIFIPAAGYAAEHQ